MNKSLEELRVLPNIVPILDDDTKIEIAQKIRQGYEDDYASCQKWIENSKKVMKIMNPQYTTVNDPWPNAANVQYPLGATAVINFAARTFPEVVRGKKVVEAEVIGRDPDHIKADRARRVSEHMSYQLLNQIDGWVSDLDKLLHTYATIGLMWRKTYYNISKNRVQSDLLYPDEVIVSANIRTLEEAPRITHVMVLNRNQVMRKIRLGEYDKLNISDLTKQTTEDEDIRFLMSNQPVDAIKSSLDDDYSFLEQQMWFDLDGDDIDEPYIGTVEKNSGKLCRLVARWDPEAVVYNNDGEVVEIEPINYYTSFSYLPSLEGKFHPMGIGQLLYPINSAVNQLSNTLINAGQLATTQAGFLGSGVRIRGGNYTLGPGEWKQLEGMMSENPGNSVMPVQYPEPSMVLFQMLGMMVDAGKDLSTVTDVLMGKENVQNVPATTMMAMIEQGLKVFNSIQRRLYESLKLEFKKIYDLNRYFLDQESYEAVLDDERAVVLLDYSEKDYDICPISDPNLSSDTQRLMKAQAQLNLMQFPEINKVEVLKQYLEALQCDNPESLLYTPEQMQEMQQPNPQLIAIQAQAVKDAAKLMLDKEKADAEIVETKAKAINQATQAAKNLSEVDSTAVDQKVRNTTTVYEKLLESIKLDQELQQDESGSLAQDVSGMGESPSNDIPEISGPQPPQ